MPKKKKLKSISSFKPISYRCGQLDRKRPRVVANNLDDYVLLFSVGHGQSTTVNKEKSDGNCEINLIKLYSCHFCYPVQVKNFSI